MWITSAYEDLNASLRSSSKHRYDLAYPIAVLRGCNVDQPRNLAKGVTVE